MRYKLLLCILVLLISTPLTAQEFSPIVIETGKPTPTVVRTGESFSITYRVKFLDTVIILEDEMKPDNLKLDKVEVIGLEINKNSFNRPENDNLGFVNVWDFTYTFRVIQPQKGEYKIPPFNFMWSLKKAGVTKEEVKDKETPKELATEEVGFNYVSSVVKPPDVDIRDEINFVSPIADASYLRIWAYVIIFISSATVLIIIFRFSKLLSSNRVRKAIEESDDNSEDVIFNVESVLPPKQARKKFMVELKKILKQNQYSGLSKEIKIHLLLRTFLLSEFQELIRDSMTNNEIYGKLTNLDKEQKNNMGRRYYLAVDMASRLRRYGEDMYSQECRLALDQEISELIIIVSRLKFRNRLGYRLRKLIGAG